MPVVTAGRAAGVQVRVSSSIDEIAASEWDGLDLGAGLFTRHRFFRAVEEFRPPGTEYYYLRVYSDGELVGTAVVSSFDTALDLLMPMPVQRACALVRRRLPRFMRLNLLFCGIPVSIGRHTLTVAGPGHRETVLDAVVRTMEEIALKRRARYLCFKEFPGTGAVWTDHLLGHGFFRAHSIPRIRLPVRWSDYGSYLSAMRAGYRRQVSGDLGRLGVRAPLEAPAEHDAGRPRFVIDDGTRCPPATFYRLYRQVMNHTVVKLEILDQRFFEALYRHLGDDIELLVLEHEDRPLAAALLTRHRGELTFLFVGIDYARRDLHAGYINLLHGIVHRGILAGCSVVDLGQTSYSLKLRLGGDPEPMHFYLRAASPLRNRLLAACRSLLFPRTRLPRRRVFRA